MWSLSFNSLQDTCTVDRTLSHIEDIILSIIISPCSILKRMSCVLGILLHSHCHTNMKYVKLIDVVFSQYHIVFFRGGKELSWVKECNKWSNSEIDEAKTPCLLYKKDFPLGKRKMQHKSTNAFETKKLPAKGNGEVPIIKWIVFTNHRKNNKKESTFYSIEELKTKTRLEWNFGFDVIVGF